jgi:hypothetical protein
MLLEAAVNTVARRRYAVQQRGGGCVARFRRFDSALGLAEGLQRECLPGQRWQVVEERRGKPRRVVWRGPEGADGEGALVPLGPPRGPLRSDAVALELPPDEEEPPDAVATTA